MIDEELLLKIKQVSLPEILASFDILPQHHKDPDSGRKCYLYRAPDRDDLHPSVSVFNRRIDGIWLWKDHATGKTGTNLDLLVGFNLFQDWREAAAFIAHDYLHIDINSKMPRLLPAVIQQPYKRDKHLTDDAKILSVRSVIGSSAAKYITDVRCIPITIADRYVRLITYNYPDKPKTYFGIAWPTIKGGWSVRWAIDLGKGKGKAVVGPGGSSIFPVQEGHKSDNCSVFEGIFDFMSFVVVSGGVITDDAIVLNSAVNANDTLPVITNYHCVDCYLDNDEAGRNATSIILSACDGKAVDRSERYAGFNDFNDYLKSIKTNNV